MPIVSTAVELIPGKNTFSAIGESVTFLEKYGWPVVHLDSGRIGKITTVETRTLTYTLEGKSGGTDVVARNDVESALNGVGLGKYRVAQIGQKLTALPSFVAQKAGEAAGSAVSGAVGKAGWGITAVFLAVASLTTVAVVGVAVVAAKRG